GGGGRARGEGDGGVEVVVERGAHDVGGDVRTGGERNRRRVQGTDDGRRDVAEIHVEVFDLAGHVAEQAGFDAGAHRPARLYLQHAERRAERAGIAGGVETDAGKGDGGPDRAYREAAGGVGDDVGRGGGGGAPAGRAERIEVVALDEVRRHRRIEVDDGRIADRAGTDIARRCALPRHLDVAFEAGHPIARLPIVAGLHAADDASEAV